MNVESERVVSLYERRAEAWVQARLLESTLYEKPWLDRFLTLIPSAGSVLDCGCGAGVPIARYCHARGHSITGIDSSAAMVRMFRARLPDQNAIVADKRTLDLMNSFDAILAWDSFFISITRLSGKCLRYFGAMPHREPPSCLPMGHFMVKLLAS
jgi:SAM-dependent methyltransferase